MRLPFIIKINFVAVYQFIRKYLFHKNPKPMCFKKWFSKPDPPFEGKRRALLFAINDYYGAGSDLNGCLNDQRDVKQTLESLYPGFAIRALRDADVTVSRVMTELTKAVYTLVEGDFLLVHYSGHGTQTYDPHGDEEDGYDEALYVYDGMVTDDVLRGILMKIPVGATVLLMLDSCFSGTATREMHCGKSKFMPNPNLPPRKKRAVKTPIEEMNWIVLSGCREDQTSADAYINGEYHGAFTYYALKSLVPGVTYTTWETALHRYLPNAYYDQYPTLEGKSSLLNKVIFT